jgi:hypothetical protein
VVARALAGEHRGEPLDRLGEAAAALVKAGLGGQLGEEVGEPLCRHGQEAAVARNPHDRLGHAEGDDLGVGDAPPRVARWGGQKIVARAINGGAESVEVGVQRGLLVDGAVNTADFGLSALCPPVTALAVESTI